MEPISDYQSILRQRIVEEKIHPPTSYPNNLLRQLAETHAADSFSAFLPFSDSVFIIGDDLNKLIRQISSFLIESFTFKAYAFVTASSTDTPTLQDVRTVQIRQNGKVEVTSEKERWYPLLFRGGIAYGEINELSVAGISCGKNVKIPNLIGTAAVTAVALEQTASGPRLFCD